MHIEREHTRLSKHNRLYWRQGGANYRKLVALPYSAVPSLLGLEVMAHTLLQRDL